MGSVSLDSLRLSVAEFEDVPDDIDEGCLLGASFSVNEHVKGSFAVVWSTVGLSQQFDIGDVVHSDCTYKCTWNNYPGTIMGFLDKNRTFHPIIVAVSSRETHCVFAFIFNTWKAANPGLLFNYLMA